VAPSDPNLISAARRQVPEAWDILLKQHQLPLYIYAAELIHDKTSALDVVQETFANAVRHIGSLRDDARFSSWLFGIAHQKCVQHWRRNRRDGEIFETDESGADDRRDDDETDPRSLLIRRENVEEFFTLVGRLPLPQRSALLLHVLEEFSLEEIAIVTGVPVGTVKSRLHHAKRALRILLEKIA
jgi:RNA polymerase sigma-70 factor (ECF subfamily)